MKNLFLSFVSVSAVALLGGCVSMDEYNRVVDHLQNEQQANVALGSENQRLAGELTRQRGENKSLLDQINAMKDVASNTPQFDYDKLRAEWEKSWGADRSSEFEWVRNGSAMGVRLDDSGVLFRSGSWDLTASTKDKLTKLADIMRSKLSGNPDAFVRIDGHTDIDPIKALSAKGIKDNVHLSTMRAMAVRDFMAEKGLPRDRIFVAGFGEHWPLEMGKDSKAKQRNRRVEIYMGSSDALSIGRLPGAQVSR